MVLRAGRSKVKELQPMKVSLLIRSGKVTGVYITGGAQQALQQTALVINPSPDTHDIITFFCCFVL